MAIDIDKARVRERQGRLDAARAELKRFFIGIDGVIDELIDAIAVWYIMPEVLTRPAIINLWGMTGVGKTDLVRRLVKQLEIQDRFVEIELSNGDRHHVTSARSAPCCEPQRSSTTPNQDRAVRRDPAIQHPRRRRQAADHHQVHRLLGAALRRSALAARADRLRLPADRPAYCRSRHPSAASEKGEDDQPRRRRSGSGRPAAEGAARAWTSDVEDLADLSTPGDDRADAGGPKTAR